MFNQKFPFTFHSLTMILYLVAAESIQVIAAPSHGVGLHHLKKRHLLQMCELISLHTNRGCLEYNNYGCYCGLGNTAGHHVDGADGCCKVHDQCYGQVSCFWFYPQFVGYSINCNSPNLCSCNDSPLFARCAYSTCLCDLALAQCLARNHYNSTLKNYDRSQCVSDM